MTPIPSRSLAYAVALGAAVLLSACNNLPASSSPSDSPGTGAPATPSPAPSPAVREPAPAPAPKAKEARDAKEGDVVGKPAPNSKFNKVQMGMGMKQVMDLIGAPTDQGAYVTGKAWIPFYFGPDRYRHELLYKGQGRLVFSGGGIGNLGAGRLSRIIHNAEETGYR